MGQFTVRVVLYGAGHSEDAYKELHAEMKTRGFTRYITGATGTTYHLPLAEYNYEEDRTSDEVWELAKEAAEQTGYEYAVLVTAGSRKWSGLKKA